MVWCASALGAADEPKPVDPGGAGQAPSDAQVLFDGKDASAWVHGDSTPASWPVIDGALEVASGTGDLYSRRAFSSAQIHLEFATPYLPDAHDQARGNSGVYLQGRYEIQILDSYRNPTYPDGSCGALYGQYPPLVNASRPPQEWQTYDIIFHAPRCSGDGQLIAPGTLTLLHNDVLVQDGVTLLGPTGGSDATNVCEPGPLRLQDHGTPVRFRNIWYRTID